MRPVLPALLLLLAAPAAVAQTTAADSILVPVHALFDAMRASDSTALRSTFLPGATLRSAVRTPEGETRLVDTPLDAFARAIGTPHPEVYDERLFDVTVQHDGGYVASVWAPYSFYVGERRSHCGVNMFQMVRTSSGWKIAGILDSRLRTGCTR